MMLADGVVDDDAAAEEKKKRRLDADNGTWAALWENKQKESEEVNKKRDAWVEATCNNKKGEEGDVRQPDDVNDAKKQKRGLDYRKIGRLMRTYCRR